MDTELTKRKILHRNKLLHSGTLIIPTVAADPFGDEASGLPQRRVIYIPSI